MAKRFQVDLTSEEEEQIKTLKEFLKVKSNSEAVRIVIREFPELRNKLEVLQQQLREFAKDGLYTKNKSGKYEKVHLIVF